MSIHLGVHRVTSAFLTTQIDALPQTARNKMRREHVNPWVCIWISKLKYMRWHDKLRSIVIIITTNPPIPKGRQIATTIYSDFEFLLGKFWERTYPGDKECSLFRHLLCLLPRHGFLGVTLLISLCVFFRFSFPISATSA